MANAWTIDKLDPKTKKALVKDILSGKPDNLIATNYSIPQKCVQRYKTDKLFHAVAEVWAEQKQDVAEGYVQKFETIAVRLNKVLDAIDKELADGDGGYDLSNAERASYYVKMLNDTSKTLQTNIKELAQIQGDIKETVAIQNNPTVILAQIGQVVEQASVDKTIKGDIIARLKQLRRADQ